MPEMDGFTVMEAIQSETDEEAYLPILILTSDISREARRRALSSGAKDFLTKPMSPTEVRFRVANLLQTRSLWLECQRQRQLLETTTSGAAEAAGDELLERWALCIDAATGAPEGHAKRVAWMATRVANELGLPAEEAELIGQSTLLHDLGAVIAPEAGRNASADPGEPGFEHPEVVGRLLDGSRAPVLRLAREIALACHERWDGLGFPAGLVAEAIPAPARIAAVAHHFDELVSGPQALPEAEALARIDQEVGSRFEPGVVEALARCLGIPVG
jgi:putative two-component system response regulator